MTTPDSIVLMAMAQKPGKAGPIRRPSVSQQIHESMRERIIALELVPGQSLSRQEIAEHYDVSQTPVRDAIMRLEEEGLLIVRPQSRTEVSRIDVAQARETQFLRLSVELEVTRRLATAADPALLEPARHIIAQQETALALPDLALFSRLDRLFHHALCNAAGVGALWTLITARSGHIDRLRNLNLPDPGKPGNIISYHRLILSCLLAGDVAGVERAVREHLSGTLASIDQIIARHPDKF